MAAAKMALLSRLLIAALIFFGNVSWAEEILLTVNVKKPLALTNDKFLSYTLNPEVVLTGNAFTENPERSINMAKALSPAYVRIGGPRSNSYTFERPHRAQNEQDPSFKITETNWINVNRWAEDAGLEILACIAPQNSGSGGQDPSWDLRNALDLISFSDHMGYNTSWQLGYECQTRCDIAGIDIGRDVMRLRSMLDAFPRYSKSIVTGPDVVAYRTRQQQQYLQDYLNVAGNALSAITWHPNFSGVTVDADGVSMHHDTLSMDKDSLFRVMGRFMWKKPLWIAESKPEECKKQFLGALVWTRRLGNAARLGAQVIMRQPDASNLLQPTPDYWVSVLHKALVGREVLDAKITTGNRTHLHFYCQCTKPSSRYEKGSLTIFGINLSPDKITINLKGLKSRTVEKYILLPGFDTENRMFAETVLLNNEPLKLVNDLELPEIKPAVSSNSKGVTLKLPSGGIGFWVLPGLKIKSCGGVDEDNGDMMPSKKMTKRPEDSEFHEVEDKDDVENLSAELSHYTLKQNKNRKRSKHYNEEDDNERRFKRIETRMDFDRLEKLLRKRSSNDEKKSSMRDRTGFSGIERTKKSFNDKAEDMEEEAGQEMLAKLVEYKKLLKEYERRIKEIESRSRDTVKKTTESDEIDSETVIEAMQLISKMENAMEKSDQAKSQIQAPKFNEIAVDDVTSDPVNSSKSLDPDDAFLDELLKSEKIKRTRVPTRIEDQLKGIYQMLADERLRRQRNVVEVDTLKAKQESSAESLATEATLSRARRQNDKKFIDDPLGLKKDSIFRKFAKYNGEARERRMERRNRRKDKDERKDGQGVIFDPKTTDDTEDFYGFQRREPMENFPEGDVYFMTGDSNEETTIAPNDYDYVKDDDEVQNLRKPMKRSNKDEGPNHVPDPDDDTWIENDYTELSHVPTEFFEDVKMAVQRAHDNPKEYEELWEAESMSGKVDNPFDSGKDKVATLRKTVNEDYNVHEDKRAKELAIKKLTAYHENPREIADYADSASIESITRPINDVTRIDQVKYPVNIHEVNYTPLRASSTRPRRSPDNLEDILDREMIFQDDNNLKDCECRVIRETKSSESHDKVDSTKRRRRGRRPDKVEFRRRIEGLSERRKNRKREGPSNLKSGDFDKVHSTRPKRDVGSFNEETLELRIEDTTSITDDRNGDDMELEEFPQTSGTVTNYDYEESKSTTDENPTSKYPEDLSNPEKNIQDTEATVEFLSKGVSEINNEQTKRSSQDGENPTEEPQVTESMAYESETTNTSASNESLELAETANIPESTFFRGPQERITEPSINAARESGTTPFITNAFASLEDLEIPPSEEGTKIIETRSIGANATIEVSTTTIPNVTAQTITESTEQVNEDNKENSTVRNSSISRAIMRIRARNQDSGIKAKPTDDDTKLGSTSSESPAMNFDNGKLSKRSKPSRIGSKVTRKTPDRLRLPLRTLAPLKLPARPDALVGLKKPIEVKNLKKSLETTDALLGLKKPTEVKNFKKSLETTDALLGLKKPSEVKNLKKSLETTDALLVLKKPTEVKNLKKSLETTDALLGLKKPTEEKTLEKSQENTGSLLSARNSQKTPSARTDALSVLKKSTDVKTQKKSDEIAAKTLSADKTKDSQTRRAEQLEKLRERLRHKREQLVKDIRDELFDELQETNDDGAQRILRRREIIDAIRNDDELYELADHGKSEYLMNKRPINYEMTEKNYGFKKVEEIGKRYVPEMVEIVRPVHVARKRRVNPQKLIIGPKNDQKLMAYALPEEKSNAEEIRKTLERGVELEDHKIESRDGKMYYSVVESLENPRLYDYRHLNEDQFGDESSVEIEDSSELNQTPIGSYNREENIDYYTDSKSEDFDVHHHEDYEEILNSHAGIDPSSENFKHSPRFIRNTSNNKYMCLKESSEENVNQNSDELYKIVREKDHYTATPIKRTKIDAEDKSKKQYFVKSNYELRRKFDSPTYARLAMDRKEKMVESDETRQESEHSDNQGLFDGMSSNLMDNENTEESNAENASWVIQRTRDHTRQSDIPITDDIDLNEALNSSKYEILMLVPIDQTEKRSRQRRHVRNELSPNRGNSVATEIFIEMPKNIEIESTHEDQNKDTIIQEISMSLNEIDDSRKTKIGDVLNDIKNNDKTSKEKDEAILHALDRELVSNDRKNAVNDKELPGLIEVAIPKLEVTVNDGIDKAKRISESFEKFIDGLDDNVDQKQSELNFTEIPEIVVENDYRMGSGILDVTFTNVKRFFDFLTKIFYVFQ